MFSRLLKSSSYNLYISYIYDETKLNQLLRHQKHGSQIIFFKEKLTHVKPLPIYVPLRGLIFANG